MEANIINFKTGARTQTGGGKISEGRKRRKMSGRGNRSVEEMVRKLWPRGENRRGGAQNKARFKSIRPSRKGKELQKIETRWKGEQVGEKGKKLREEMGTLQGGEGKSANSGPRKNRDGGKLENSRKFGWEAEGDHEERRRREKVARQGNKVPVGGVHRLPFRNRRQLQEYAKIRETCPGTSRGECSGKALKKLQKYTKDREKMGGKKARVTQGSRCCRGKAPYPRFFSLSVGMAKCNGEEGQKGNMEKERMAGEKM